MLTQEENKDLFACYPVLSQVDPDLIEASLSQARLVRLKAGTPVFRELDPCQTFPFVLSGKIRIFKHAASGRELSLYTVEPGDTCIVTTGCLLGHGAYHAAGTVKADAALVMLPADGFDRLLSAPGFRAFIFSLIAKRILGLMQLVEEVAFHKLDQRLAALLVRQGSQVLASHQELADELGTVREMVTRVLSSFADTGLIRLGRGKIEILDRQGLTQFFDP